MKYRIPEGAYVGALWKSFYTTREGRKEIKLQGYLILGVFGCEICGKEISVYRVRDINRKPRWLDPEKDFYVIRSGRRSFGFLVREVIEGRNGRKHEYFWGQVDFGGLKVKIRVRPDRSFNMEDEKGENKTKNRKPDYRIELGENLKCAVVEL